MELEIAIGDLLRKNGMSLSVAESCTGGLVSDRITDVSGSSDYFKGGVVSYSIEAKAKYLDIPIKYIERYGAVSPQVAKRMAEGVRKGFHTTIGLSTTGVAGPTGGTKKTPVGTVFIGVSDGKGLHVRKVSLKGNRREIKEKAARRSLEFFYERLIKSIRNRGIRNSEGGSKTRDSIEELSRSRESAMVLVRKAPQGISKERGCLGVFPASFNPPTKAHLALIREARKQAGLDEILVLLDIRAMDKKPVHAGFEDRLAMLKKIFEKDSKISIGLSNRGLFLEKLKPLRRYYPAPVRFFFILGFDTILRVMDKKYYRNCRKSWDELFNRSYFLVANRGDQEGGALIRLFNKPKNRRYRDKVSFFTLPPKFSTLSSTLIRERIGQDQPVAEWVPAATLQFIREKGLYKTG